MKASLLLLILFVMTGCTGAMRLLTDTAAAGGGAALGHKLGKGSVAATAGGAGAGVLVSEGLNYASANAAENAKGEGYDKGRSDAVKQQYWIMVNQHKATDPASEEKVSLYDIPLPEQQIDGVTLKPTTKTLRIEE